MGGVDVNPYEVPKSEIAPTRPLRRWLRRARRVLLQLLNVVALAAAVTIGMIGGALSLTAVAEYFGVPSTFGIPMIGIGLGGQAGFFLWAVPQMPTRKT